MNAAHSNALHGLALLAVEQDRIEDAVALLRSAVAESPGNAAAWNDLGVVMEVLGNPRRAVECYALAIGADPAHMEARSNLIALGVQLEARRRMRETAPYAVMSKMGSAPRPVRAARANSV